MKERRQVDQNQKNRMVKIWLSIFGTILILIGLIATGSVKINQIKINKEDIKSVEEIARDNEKMIGRFEERFDAIDKTLERIEDKL